MSKKDFMKVLDIIVWLVLIFIFTYSILKLTGVVHSFDWALVIGASIIAGRYMQKMDTIVKDVEGIKKTCPKFPTCQ